MLGFLSAYDENEKQAKKEKIYFVSIKGKDKKTIKIEIKPIALAMARYLNLKKIYLFYDKEKIIYDFKD